MIKDTIKRTITCDHPDACAEQVEYDIVISEAPSGNLQIINPCAHPAAAWQTGFGRTYCPKHRTAAQP